MQITALSVVQMPVLVVPKAIFMGIINLPARHSFTTLIPWCSLMKSGWSVTKVPVWSCSRTYNTSGLSPKLVEPKYPTEW